MTVFSQFGEVVDIHLVRDRETGKSKGFCYLCYEDQRSTTLAVDNLNGIEIVGKKILVDHSDEFKIPHEYLQIKENEEVAEKTLYKPSGPDGKGWGEFREEVEEAVSEIELGKVEDELEEDVFS